MTGSIIILVLTLVMPERVPDQRVQIKEPDIKTCWQDAAEFVARGVPKQVEGATAVMAACLVPDAPSDDL